MDANPSLAARPIESLPRGLTLNSTDMPLHDGATTEQLLAEGYTIAPRGRWMRLDSSWMAICESCGRWYSELPDRHFCSRCHAELYRGDPPDLPSLQPLVCQGTFAYAFLPGVDGNHGWRGGGHGDDQITRTLFADSAMPVRSRGNGQKRGPRLPAGRDNRRPILSLTRSDTPLT